MSFIVVPTLCWSTQRVKPNQRGTDYDDSICSINGMGVCLLFPIQYSQLPSTNRHRRAGKAFCFIKDLEIRFTEFHYPVGFPGNGWGRKGSWAIASWNLSEDRHLFTSFQHGVGGKYFDWSAPSKSNGVSMSCQVMVYHAMLASSNLHNNSSGDKFRILVRGWETYYWMSQQWCGILSLHATVEVEQATPSEQSSGQVCDNVCNSGL